MNAIAAACSSKELTFDLDWAGPLLFCREAVLRVPSGIPGAYLLHVVDPRRRRYAVVYAGKSTDLLGRLVHHLQMRSTRGYVLVARRAADLYFSAAPVLGWELRGAVQAALIASLRPPFNRQCPRPASEWPQRDAAAGGHQLPLVAKKEEP